MAVTIGEFLNSNKQQVQNVSAPTTTEPAPASAPTDAATAPAPATPAAPAAPAAPTVPTLPTMPQREIKPEESVSTQLQKLTSQANPLLKSAETKARQQAAGRGLLSSTMAEQAAKQAVIETAAPIASQEAAAAQQAGSQQYQAQIAEHERALDQAFQKQNMEASQINDLKTRYRSDVRATNDLYDRMAADIQNMPGLSAADKEQRLLQNEAARATASTTLNATYQAEPQWQSSWSVIPGGEAQAELTKRAAEATKQEVSKLQSDYSSLKASRDQFDKAISALPYSMRQKQKPKLAQMDQQLQSMQQRITDLNKGIA